MDIKYYQAGVKEANGVIELTMASKPSREDLRACIEEQLSAVTNNRDVYRVRKNEKMASRFQGMVDVYSTAMLLMGEQTL